MATAERSGAAKAGAEKTAAKAARPKAGLASGGQANRLIDARIRELGDWRGEALGRMRALILEADPQITEEWKWNNPVWSHGGIICTGEVYKSAVKLTFAHGASLPDPKELFNSSLDGNTRRAIDIREGEKVDARAFKGLVKAAVARNQAPRSKKPVARARKTGAKERVVYLAGGNPQIAKGDGDAPVQRYIAAMPGWKRGIGERLDALIVRTVPGVRKAVKWNSPFYGVEGRGWFLNVHVLTRSVKVTFFSGASLNPVPPGAGKDANARWLDIYEDVGLDEKQMASWVKQAAAIPGWDPGKK